jgi:hypothetical protein
VADTIHLGQERLSSFAAIVVSMEAPRSHGGQWEPALALRGASAASS